MMRYLFAAPILMALAAPAGAENIIGTYEVKFELSSNNCSTELLKFGRMDLKIAMKGNLISVDIERVPLMTGQPTKTGKITAKSKPGGGHTAIAGMDGNFQVAGRVQNGLLSLVFTGEYHTAADKKPLCGQSWNISGTRKDEEPKKAPDKGSGSATPKK